MQMQNDRTIGLSRQLTRHLEQAFTIRRVANLRYIITTPFVWPYDDPIDLLLTIQDDGRGIISDAGETQSWLNEVNGFHSRRKLSVGDRSFWDLICQLYETRRNDANALEKDADLNNIGPAVVRLVQTIVHILGPEPREGPTELHDEIHDEDTHEPKVIWRLNPNFTAAAAN